MANVRQVLGGNMHDQDVITDLARRLGEQLKGRQWRVTAAESCTGGGICEAITRVAGSSAWFDAGFVVYANRSKARLLGVSVDALRAEGAVSEQVVTEMAAGALGSSGADVAVAVSGVAGPDGGTPEKPVGTVWIAWQKRDGTGWARCHHFEGDRASVRYATVKTALEGLLELIAI